MTSFTGLDPQFDPYCPRFNPTLLPRGLSRGSSVSFLSSRLLLLSISSSFVGLNTYIGNSNNRVLFNHTGIGA
jgi:hypothetical protein